jgi:two-component system sensor histidine kinase/response regulator
MPHPDPDTLNALEAELDALIYFITHDLKNPLSAVMGYAGMLVSDVSCLSEAQIRRSAEVIYLACAKMNHQIADLHALARVRKLDGVTCQPLDMAQIVADVCDMLHDQIAESQAEILYPDRWPEVRGFAPWVEDMWLHYLSNALTHGRYPADSPPQIELGADVQAGEQGHSVVRCWVRDYGPGIAPDEQAKLFVSFEQIGSVHHSTRGLGLALVRRIADRLDGSVGVESTGVPGDGCLFFFTLPDARCE